MDIKTHILRWEHEISENNAIAVLAILIFIAVAFVLAIAIDAILKSRKENNRRRRK